MWRSSKRDVVNQVSEMGLPIEHVIGLITERNLHVIILC